MTSYITRKVLIPLKSSKDILKANPEMPYKAVWGPRSSYAALHVRMTRWIGITCPTLCSFMLVSIPCSLMVTTISQDAVMACETVAQHRCIPLHHGQTCFAQHLKTADRMQTQKRCTALGTEWPGCRWDLSEQYGIAAV